MKESNILSLIGPFIFPLITTESYWSLLSLRAGQETNSSIPEVDRGHKDFTLLNILLIIIVNPLYLFSCSYNLIW